MAGVGCDEVVFEDLFPVMVESLGTKGFMMELCDGFRLLAEEEKGVITFASLKKKSSALLGLPAGHTMSDEEVRCMLKERDMDGDGCLNKMEFCVLMFRVSPDLMNKSRLWLIADAKERSDELQTRMKNHWRKNRRERKLGF